MSRPARSGTPTLDHPPDPDQPMTHRRKLEVDLARWPLREPFAISRHVFQDSLLQRPPGSLRYCADESCTDRHSLPEVARRYQMINVKLDKTGGLTEALALIEAATRQGLPWMVGSNGGTSLAMAPLYLLAHGALLVDAGVGHLTQDRHPGLDVRQGLMHAPSPALWG